ncbi:hypothetical protein HK102_000326, partial [Quaeritorhiza haematococci]
SERHGLVLGTKAVQQVQRLVLGVIYTATLYEDESFLENHFPARTLSQFLSDFVASQRSLDFLRGESLLHLLYAYVISLSRDVDRGNDFQPQVHSKLFLAIRANFDASASTAGATEPGTNETVQEDATSWYDRSLFRHDRVLMSWIWKHAASTWSFRQMAKEWTKQWVLKKVTVLAQNVTTASDSNVEKAAANDLTVSVELVFSHLPGFDILLELLGDALANPSTPGYRNVEAGDGNECEESVRILEVVNLIVDVWIGKTREDEREERRRRSKEGHRENGDGDDVTRRKEEGKECLRRMWKTLIGGVCGQRQQVSSSTSAARTDTGLRTEASHLESKGFPPRYDVVQSTQFDVTPMLHTTLSDLQQVFSKTNALITPSLASTNGGDPHTKRDQLDGSCSAKEIEDASFLLQSSLGVVNFLNVVMRLRENRSAQQYLRSFPVFIEFLYKWVFPSTSATTLVNGSGSGSSSSSSNRPHTTSTTSLASSDARSGDNNGAQAENGPEKNAETSKTLVGEPIILDDEGRDNGGDDTEGNSSGESCRMAREMLSTMISILRAATGMLLAGVLEEEYANNQRCQTDTNRRETEWLKRLVQRDHICEMLYTGSLSAGDVDDAGYPDRVPHLSTQEASSERFGPRVLARFNPNR